YPLKWSVLDARWTPPPSIGRSLSSIIWIRFFLNSTGRILKETSVIPVPQAQNSHPCEVWTQQAGSQSGTAACGRKQMKPREGSSAQDREGQDFLGGDQMPAA